LFGLFFDIRFVNEKKVALSIPVGGRGISGLFHILRFDDIYFRSLQLLMKNGEEVTENKKSPVCDKQRIFTTIDYSITIKEREINNL
jgi:hypothetical protein